MNFRCHECGETFESHHTNYKYAKGFHPSDNPASTMEKAIETDHCLNCQHLRKYDPVKARQRDLVSASGASNPAIGQLTSQVETLKAQLAQAANDRTVALSLQEQVKELSAKLSAMAPPTPSPAT